MTMFRILMMLAFAFSGTTAAVAQSTNAVSLNSDVLVERTTVDANGRAQVTLEEPQVVVPGDKLVFVLRYQNNGRAPASDFVVTNPLPHAVAFQASADQRSQVSIDGGQSWGQLDQLKVRDADGATRPARADEVTHVRWAFAQPIPAGEAGRLMFRGIVR
jgi:uncharacterized repeat protein (TIGR01451 family)